MLVLVDDKLCFFSPCVLIVDVTAPSPHIPRRTRFARFASNKSRASLMVWIRSLTSPHPVYYIIGAVLELHDNSRVWFKIGRFKDQTQKTVTCMRSHQWRIQDFPEKGNQPQKWDVNV